MEKLFYSGQIQTSLSEYVIIFWKYIFILIICEILVRIFFNQTAYTVSSYPERMFDSKSETRLRPNFKVNLHPVSFPPQFILIPLDFVIMNRFLTLQYIEF